MSYIWWVTGCCGCCAVVGYESTTLPNKKNVLVCILQNWPIVIVIVKISLDKEGSPSRVMVNTWSQLFLFIAFFLAKMQARYKGVDVDMF